MPARSLIAKGRPLLGQLLLKAGLLTKEQLQEALRAQAEQKNYVPFEQILIDGKVITQAQLNSVLDEYQKKHRLGGILVEMKAITEEQLRQALQEQQKAGLRLGDTLLKLNFVSERQMKQALCKQFGATFVDLDTLAIDRSLAHLISKSYAQAHRVIPIARTEQGLTVAMDDPADVEVVEELETSTGHPVEVLTSTYAAFQRAFLRAYADAAPAAPTPPPGAIRPQPTPPPAAPATDASAIKERDAAVQALGELEGRHAETARSLGELQAAHQALVAEREAGAQTLLTLETRHAETERALAELRAAHEALRMEREAQAPGPDTAAPEELEALRRERDATAEALRELTARHAETERALEELRGARRPTPRSWRRSRRCAGTGTRWPRPSGRWRRSTRRPSGRSTSYGQPTNPS